MAHATFCCDQCGNPQLKQIIYTSLFVHGNFCSPQCVDEAESEVLGGYFS